MGGYALARLNDTKDSTQFEPVFALPPQWLLSVNAVVQEYRDPKNAVQKQLESSEWLLNRLKSPNPTWRIIALRALLQKPKLEASQMREIQNQFVAETGFEKAMFARLIIDSDKETGRFQNLLSKEVLGSLNKVSDQDVFLLLNTLIASDILRTHNPITGKENPAFGPSLLRVLSAKVAASDDTTPLSVENKTLLQSFVIGPVKVDFSPVPDQEKK